MPTVLASSFKETSMPRCPKCATPLTRVQEEGINHHTCGGCFGTWIERVRLIRLVRLALPPAAASQPLEELAALVAESDTKQMLRCPECATPMRRDRYHPLIPVNLDQCPKCQGYWLDAGELTLLRRLYTEMQQSSDPRIASLREKVAQIGLDAEMQRERDADALNSARNAASVSYEDGLFTLTHLLRILSR